MAIYTATPVHYIWRNLIPAATVLLGIALDCLPLPNAAPYTVAPLFSICIVFYWSAYRPDLLGPVALFFLMVVHDALAGLPLGISSFATLVTRWSLLPKDRFLASTSFGILWVCFCLGCLSIIGLRWLILCYLNATWFDFSSTFIQWLLTILVYPLVGFLLSRTLSYLPRIKHVTGS